MKFNPIISRISSQFTNGINKMANGSGTHQVSTIKQQQDQQIQSQLNQAISERKKLAAAEFSNPDPRKTNFRQRGEIIARRIAELQSKTKI